MLAEGSNIKVIDATIKHEAPVSLPVPRLESPRGARFNASIFFPRPFAEPEPRISTLVSWLNACYYSRQDFSSAVQFFFSSSSSFPSNEKLVRITFRFLFTCVSVNFRSKINQSRQTISINKIKASLQTIRRKEYKEVYEFKNRYT